MGLIIAMPSEPGLFCVHYISRMALDDESNECVEEITEHARRRNKERMVTGIMFHEPDTNRVYQCLEGPRDVVEHLFRNILADGRHTDVQVVKMQPITSRIYEGWMNRTVVESVFFDRVQKQVTSM